MYAITMKRPVIGWIKAIPPFLHLEFLAPTQTYRRLLFPLSKVTTFLIRFQSVLTLFNTAVVETNAFLETCGSTLKEQQIRL